MKIMIEYWVASIESLRSTGLSLQQLLHYMDDGDNFLQQIVADDKTWCQSKLPPGSRQHVIETPRLT
ncbi:hypothetical protein TNCV_1024111 [Trichonephila clavipes]|nr:hypothetical protein TNCV_1024111 [Trichonephila clavipes]